MRPSMFMGGSGLPPATFIGAAGQSGAGWTALNYGSIAGLQVGDYLFAFTISTPESSYASINQAGWTQDNYRWPVYGYPSSVFHRRLTTLTAPLVSVPGSGGVLIAAYRGASRAARRVANFDNDGNTTHVVPGFTRENDCVGVICQIWDRDTDGSDFGVSAGWTRRFMGQPFVDAALADALPRNSYVDGASLTWSNLGTEGPYAEVAMMYELRI